uniref:Uncharacterized protein n=1 Tax=Ackermannviridae sp. ctaCq7 TaxID=2827294 RepID=A0A8S5R6A5_9CAUD|nr:MAG TPA: hypothetical protein [Ackermannviridae sp. ctaCq7]
MKYWESMGVTEEEPCVNIEFDTKNKKILIMKVKKENDV